MLCTEVLVPRAGQPPGWPATQQLRLPLSRELQHSPSTRLSKYISWAQSHSSLLLGRDRAEDKLCRAADRQRDTLLPLQLAAYARPGSALRLCGCSGFPVPIFGDTIRHCKGAKPNHFLCELA